MKKIHRRLFAPLAAALVLTFAGCGGGGGGSTGTATADSGTFRVALTDAPACGYDQVNVTVQKVRVHQSSTASDTDDGWSEVVLNPAQRVDLLSLTNGVLAELGQVQLPAGHYSQLRLVLASNDATTPMANSVVPTGGSETALSTPSAQQSGLKMNLDLDVAANQLADLVLDFNACKSVVRAGNSGRYLLKPVVSVIPRFASGVIGYVDTSIASGNTSVSVQQGGTVVKATAPDSTGKFVLEPVAPGTYDLVITSPGHVTTVITGVPVADATVTTLNGSTSQFAPALAATGNAVGTVTTPTTPIDATVRGTQTLANAHTIEIVSGPADATTGAYAYALPASAPMVAAYVAAPGTLSFAADATAGAKYGLQAASGGTTKSAGPVTITSGGTVTTNFSF